MSSLISITTSHSVHDVRIQCRQRHLNATALKHKGCFTQSKTLANIGCGRRVTVFAPTRVRRGRDKQHYAGCGYAWVAVGLRGAGWVSVSSLLLSEQSDPM